MRTCVVALACVLLVGGARAVLRAAQSLVCGKCSANLRRAASEPAERSDAGTQTRLNEVRVVEKHGGDGGESEWRKNMAGLRWVEEAA